MSLFTIGEIVSLGTLPFNCSSDFKDETLSEQQNKVDCRGLAFSLLYD